MVPFKTPAWRKKLIDQKYKRKDRVISRAVKQMESVMRSAVDYIMEHYEKTGRYVEPSLNAMYAVSEDFYRNVVHQAFYSAQDEKEVQNENEKISPTPGGNKLPEKKLTKMARWPIGIPRSLEGLEKIFRDKRYWPKIMKRSEAVTDQVRKMYLKKLQKKFSKIVPDLDSGAISPAEAKENLMEAWDASKSRVELIFRTETTTYFGKTQTAFFQSDPEIIGFLFDSVKDTSRTPWCRSRHGLVYKPGTTGPKGLTYNTPSLHWNCRSQLIPLANTPNNRKLLEDPNRDPLNRSVAELPPGWRK